MGAGTQRITHPWIVAQIAVIRTFSWLQPVMAMAGVAVVVCTITRPRGR